MKVAVTAEQLKYRTPGGIATYIRGLASGLAGREKVETDFYVPSMPIPLVTRLWALGLSNIGHNANIVHATCLRIPPTKLPMTVTIHDLLWKSHPEFFPAKGQDWHAKQFEKAKDRASAFVVPSVATADALMQNGVRSEIIHTVSWGCDHLPEPDLPAAQAKLASVGIDSEFLLVVGTQEPRKNLNRILESWRQARDKSSSVPNLVLVGPSGWGQDVEEKLPTINDAAPQELAGLYKLAMATIYAPIVEGFGLPPLESMQQGTPVVVSNVPSTTDAALFVEPESLESIRDSIIQISEKSDLRTELSERGKQYIKDRTWRAAGDQHLDIWGSIS